MRNLLGYVGASEFYQSTIPECLGYLQSIEPYDAECAREKESARAVVSSVHAGMNLCLCASS